MSLRSMRMPLVLALALAGCQNPAETPAPSAAASPMLQSLAGDSPYAPLPVLGVRASSVSAAAQLAPTNAFDGNASTAWGPSASDSTPSLIFQFAAPMKVEALVIQADIAGKPAGGHQILVDGEVASGNSTSWQTTFRGLSPTAGQQVQFGVEPATGSQYRLSFRTTDPALLGALRIHEVQLFGEPAPSTAVSSPSPSPSPSAMLFGGTSSGGLSPWFQTSPEPTASDTSWFYAPSPSPTPTPTPTPESSPDATPTPTPSSSDTATGGYTTLVGSGWMQHANWMGPADSNAVRVDFDVHVIAGTQHGALALQDFGYNQQYTGIVTGMTLSADGQNAVLNGSIAGSGVPFSAMITRDANDQFTHFGITVNGGVIIDSDVAKGALNVSSVNGPEDLSDIQKLLQ